MLGHSSKSLGLEEAIEEGNRPIEPLLPAASYKTEFKLLEKMTSFLQRETYVQRYGWVLLTRECVDSLAQILKGRRVIDLGAGTGFLAHCLCERGVDVTAVDEAPPGSLPPEIPDDRKLWKNDIRGDSLEQPINEYDVIILSWPEYRSEVAAKVARMMSVGQLLVYQGELLGGNCAEDSFFDELDVKRWSVLEAETDLLNSNHRRFADMKDCWVVLKRISV